MKKLLASFLTLLFLSASVFAGTVNSYDKYGRKTSSYRETSIGYESYDKYSSKSA
jgi:hypothetical protein